MTARHELDPRRGRDGRPWQRIVRELLGNGAECTWPDCDCPGGRWIDPDLPATSRWSGTVDHIQALEDGGHPTTPENLTTMHRRCNSRKEAARKAERRDAARAANKTRHSRQW